MREIDVFGNNTADEIRNNIKCLAGTFAAEGISISDHTRSNLERIAAGQTTYQQILNELREKYRKDV